MMYHLHLLEEQLGVLRIFESITLRASLACVTAFLLCIVLGPRVIAILVALKAGQPIRDAAEIHRLHALHGNKAGTPTMGGVLIIGAVTLSTLLWARVGMPFVQTALFVMIAAGAVGFADDYLKIRRRKSDGLSARAKLIALAAIALVAGAYLAWHPSTGSFIRAFHIPFLKTPLFSDIGWLCLPFFALVIVGASNAVNLTDGLDGLATGCTITTTAAYGLLAYAAGTFTIAEYLLIPHHPSLGELAVFCSALAGAAFGFLWFNCHPAQVFMGDTGSLAIGAVIGLIAIAVRHELLLILIGGIFVAEALSVILQVGSFKLRGKRIFRMAPIHHHFELKGWHENKVIMRFWMVSAFLAVVGLASLKLR